MDTDWRLVEDDAVKIVGPLLKLAMQTVPGKVVEHVRHGPFFESVVTLRASNGVYIGGLEGSADDLVNRVTAWIHDACPQGWEFTVSGEVYGFYPKDRDGESTTEG